MRSIIILAAALSITACAGPATTPEKPAEKAPAPAAEKKGPQCWSGEAGKFVDVGTKSAEAGVAVECKPTGDGKSAQWVGGKH